ncbi:MAG: hypothetical protein R6V02_00315 [Candidatus Aminicenantes bacterium]
MIYIENRFLAAMGAGDGSPPRGCPPDAPSEDIRSHSGFAPLSCGEEPCLLSLHPGGGGVVSYKRSA